MTKKTGSKIIEISWCSWHRKIANIKRNYKCFALNAVKKTTE
jgi:hypothetical protein